VSPVTDLLDFSRENPSLGDLGYGELTSESNFVDMISDSPYHSDQLKFLKNTLFLSSSHITGFHGLKLFAKAQNLFAKDSNNFYRFLE
jgi:hypothetical protein